MSGLYPAPKENEIHQMLAMLYGDDLVLDSGEPVPMDSSSMIAVYINDESAPAAACVCNHQFVAFAGSALTKIPVGGAEDAAATGDFSEMMLANLHEIMNICTRLFMNNSSPHIKLDRVYSSVDEVPKAVLGVFGNSAARIDFNILIPGYGNGGLSFLST